MKKLMGSFLGATFLTVVFAVASLLMLMEILAPNTSKGEAIMLAFALVIYVAVTCAAIAQSIKMLKKILVKCKKKRIEKQKKMLKLNSKRHFYLYAKGWYKKTNLLEDLKKICSAYSGLDPKHIKLGDIFVVLSKEVYKYINTLPAFMYFVDDLAPLSVWIYGDAPRDVENYWIRVLNKYMSILFRARVYNDEGVLILNLGDPDPKILPLWDSVE